MRILITGGAGFIGSHLAGELRTRGHKIAIYDNYDPQVHGGKKGPGRGDVLDLPRLKRVASKADAVVHFAAAVGVGQSQYQIKHYVDTNVGGTANLLEVLSQRKSKPKKVLVAGSMSAYGEGAYECAECGRVRPQIRTTVGEPVCPVCGGALRAVGTRETDRFICSSIYAVTKMTQEELVLNYGAAYDVPVVSMRFFNVYGPGQSLSNPYTGVAAIFMSRIKNGQPPPIYEDGAQTRDFVSVHDVARACALALEKKATGAFNVGTGRAVSIREIAERLIRIYGAKVEPQILGTFRRGDVRHCWADISRIRERLEFDPTVTLDEGLRELVEWSRTAKAADRFEKAHRELAKRGLA